MGVTDLTTAENAGDAVDLGILGSMIGYHLRRALGAFNIDYARAVAGTGIRQGLFGILSVIAANPGISQGMVGRALGIQRANMVALINELVGMGYVDREASADDRRAFSLTLTAAGHAMLQESAVRIREHEELMLAGLTAAQRRSLAAMLAEIAAVEI